MTRSVPDDVPCDRLAILPGLLCDSRMFANQVAEFNALVIDGFYGGADTISAMADYALARLPDRCALMGHSMGARVALEIWSRAPERISRLALASTGTHPPSDGEAEKRYRLLDLGREKGGAALVDAWLPPMIGQAHRDDAELFAMLRQMAIDAGVAVFERQIRALLARPDARSVLPTITCPVLVLVGRDDEWSPIGQLEAIAAAIPAADLHVIEGAGHMAPAEMPEQFNAALRNWLSGNTPAASLS